MPVYPGAAPADSESAFQQRLLELFQNPGSPPPRVEIYRTPDAFAAVADYYAEKLPRAGLTRQRFAVASRMRELADGARGGGRQQVAVGRLLFGRGPADNDSLPADAVADSLSGLAERLEGIEGLIALGKAVLATSPPSIALISIERPHLNTASLKVDSLTVITVVVQPGRASR